MKTAIYIEDGIVQLVITPESDFEKNAIQILGEGEVPAQKFKGSFYDCRGGWIRQSVEKDSLILRVETKSAKG